MSLLARLKKTETRDISSGPWSVGIDGSPAAVTPDRALTLVPVFAAHRLLADEISTLPIDTYRKVGETRTRISTPQLLQQPSAFGTPQEWVYQCVTSLAAWGNAYGLVTSRDGYGFPTGLEWLSPASVTVDEQRVTQPRYYYLGREVPSEDIVHIRWHVQPGRVVALSPLQVLKDTVTTGLGAMDYKADWFQNGGVPPGTFKNTSKEVDPAASEAIKRRLVASIRKHQPIVHGSDWTYESISLPADSSEFVATMKLTANAIAAAYGLPPSKLGGEPGGSLTYSTTEQESIDLRRAMRPWISRIEDHISALLPDRAFISFNSDALVSTDLTTRMNAYLTQRRIGLRNVDELRALEDLPPLPGGQGASYAPLTNVAPPPEGDTPNGDAQH